MRFYYFSLFSWMVYPMMVLFAIGVLLLLWTRVFKLKFTNPIFWVLVAALVVLPWAEELWIAYYFGQLCSKDAGAFVNKVVEVDGFYDDTKGWRHGLKESGYRFVESRDNIYNTLWRTEIVGNEVRHFRIERPTARYQYRQTHNHTPIAHKITKIEDVVIDSQTNDVLARETIYARRAYWFFIALDAPVLLCPGAKERPSPGVGPIYSAALKPSARR